jgi:Ran GTPase-activating protein (RanGAP) involved in mRNA processing and transport
MACTDQMPVVTRSVAVFGVMSTAHELKPGCVQVVSKKVGLEGNRQIVQLEAETPEWDMGVFRALVRLMETHYILEMNLSKMGLVYDHIDRLFPMLPECKHLRRLDLSRNDLKRPATLRLAKVLGSLKCLEHLDISTCTITAEVAGELAPVLPQLEMLQSLNMSITGMGDEAIKVIALELPKMESLGSLDLGFNEISSGGTEHLANGLKGCRGLKSLCLDHNELWLTPIACPIGQDGVFHLAKILPKMEKLESLEMNCCGISDRHAEPLAEALQSCHKLERLGLYGNNFETQGYEILREQIRRMPGLRVDIWYNADPPYAFVVPMAAPSYASEELPRDQEVEPAAQQHGGGCPRYVTRSEKRKWAALNRDK